MYIDPKECNPDRDIQTNTPTNPNRRNTHPITNLFDNEGIHIQTIITQNLKWLWIQYNEFKNKQISRI
jgi:hypothetical protein